IKLEITVPAEDFAAAMNKSYQKNVKHINIQGFRKGKAPRGLIEKVYGEAIFYDDAADIIMQDTYGAALDQEGVEPVDRPEVEIKEIGTGKDFVYVATVTTKPVPELGKYKGVKVKKVEYAVTDEDVDAEINNMKERAARFVDVTDAPAADGDVAVIDFEGFVDDVAFEGGKGENHNLTLGSGQFIPGFEEQIVGKNIGEEFDVNVTFPEEYHAKDLAGKPAVFKVKLNGLKKKEYPELDDEFAKDVSEFDTFEQLKEETKKRLVANAENRAQREQEDAVLEAAVKTMKVEIPEVMVDNQVEQYLEDAKYKIQAQMPGITFEQYLQFTGGSVEDFKASVKDQAKKDVEINLLIEAIAKAEEITVTDEEAEEEIAKLAEQYKMEVEKIKSILSMDQIKSNLVPRKVIDLLIAEAKIA
ncbi:MAG: trigger factor, partial [Clostridia bacterium]|nr:trigger factor [Clostridia bacterium]